MMTATRKKRLKIGQGGMMKVGTRARKRNYRMNKEGNNDIRKRKNMKTRSRQHEQK